MNIDQFSTIAQEGFRLWAKEKMDDELAFDCAGTRDWAWFCFLLKVSPDRPEWFPKGKWATIQLIEEGLLKEAALEIVHP